MSNQRTITLTGRPPVKISEDEWPVIAHADWDDCDSQYEFEANRTAKAVLKVRRHADGRSLVYGTYRYLTQFADDSDVHAAAGSLLGPGEGMDDVITAIRETTGRLSSYDSLPGNWQPDWPMLTDDCIAGLPAEEL